MTTTTTHFGVIRKLTDKFGFIRTDAGEDRFFLPMTVEPKGTPWAALVEGDRVSFKPTEHPEKGLRAEAVRVVLEVPSSERWDAVGA